MWWVLIKSSIALIALTACTPTTPQIAPHTLYLASSLMPIKGALERGAKGKFSLNLIFQSSALIAQQLSSGARCDAVIVADERWRDYLQQKEVVDDEGSVVAYNRLIVAGTKPRVVLDAGAFLRQIGSQKIIIGDPATCPLGTFSKEALKGLGVFDALKPNVIMAHNAQNARMLLSSGVAPYAILYASDLGPPVEQIAPIDKKLHLPISYPFLRCKNASRIRSDALFDLVFSPEVNAALRAQGFEPHHE